MKYTIKHEIKGRIRVHLLCPSMTDTQADTLQYYLENLALVTSVKVRERTQDVTICYDGNRTQILLALNAFSYETAELPDTCQNSSRGLNREYYDKLVTKTVLHYGSKLFLPLPVRSVLTACHSVRYIRDGIATLLKRKIEVPVLDATAIAVSLIRNDISTASSVMFLLGIGEILEEWTHKKSVDDLARSMSLNIHKVWLCSDGTEILVPTSEICVGDQVCIHTGNVIPFDGTVVKGEAMVNQASLTGESIPVCKQIGSTVYAGTVIEEGSLIISVQKVSGSGKFDEIVAMIEDSEKLKSSAESRAEHLADKLVPYTLAGTGLVWLFTRNVTKALAVLMVDFSCALKLAMPISVLSAIREASTYSITVKGGKYLEVMAQADTIIFDKTGTLTNAQPVVMDVVPFNEMHSDELLRIAACLEEHFPHSMAKAVVDAALQKGLVHNELHSKVEYIVAHGISSQIDEAKVVIGSYHFVFEDEGCQIPQGMEQQFADLPSEYSHLYMAIDYQLAAVICIQDPLRKEATAVVARLKDTGIQKIVMMTGDSDRTAKAIAQKVGVDAYYSEVLPQDKAQFINDEKAAGRTVVMIGDGINDSPALSAANIGIAISDGAEIARQIADVTIGANSLWELLILKNISDALMQRIQKNYRFIVGFNTGLILLGVGGIIQPTLSALLHNTSTLIIGLKSMNNLLPEQPTNQE